MTNVGTYITSKDYQKGSLAQASETPVTMTFGGGDYAMSVHAGTWNSGSVDLQIMLPDNVSFVTVLPATFAADGLKTIIGLPPGQYKVVITTTNDVYYAVERVRRGAGP